MPANVVRTRYVYNSGVEKRALFVDEEDYKVFIGYLSDYLSSLNNVSATKTTFTVRGKTYSGTPHQTKNFYGRINLLAYNLTPQSFNLVLRELEPGAIEKFLRSLSTRYSIYFNKRHARTGSLFAGPYKSVDVIGENELKNLASTLHAIPNTWSSYFDYKGLKNTSWVLKDENLSPPATPISPEPKPVPEVVFPEKEDLTNIDQNKSESIIKAFEPPANTKASQPLRLPEIGMALVIFVILTFLSIKNINNSQAQELAQINSSPRPAVLAEETVSSPEPTAIPELVTVPLETQTTPTPSPKASVSPSPIPLEHNIAKGSLSNQSISFIIPEGSDGINVRESPTLSAKMIYTAKANDKFELISQTTGWYEIKITASVSGFVTDKVQAIITEIKK